MNTVDVYNGISIDECRYKCFVDETCQHFNYEEGTCTIGYGLYEQTSHLGNNLISSDKYKLSYLDSGVLERVNRYFKRARMMQGRYSVLHELGINDIVGVWHGCDWLTARAQARAGGAGRVDSIEARGDAHGGLHAEEAHGRLPEEEEDRPPASSGQSRVVGGGRGLKIVSEN